MADASIIPEVPGFDMNNIMGLLNGLFGTNSSTTTTDSSPQGSAASMAFLAPLLQQFFDPAFSQEQAVKDASGSINLIMKQAMESGLVPIMGAENAAGGYNSTTAALLKNDLASRTAGQGAAQLAAIKAQYAGQKNQQASLILSLINTLTNASRVRTSNTNNQGLVNNPNAQKAMAAATLAAMAKRAAQDAAGKKPSKSPNKAPKPDQSGEQSNEQALNDIAKEMGYGAGDKDNPNEVLTSQPSEMSDQEMIDRSGLNDYSNAIADRQDQASDPNYDPYDLMGNLGDGQPGGEGDFTGPSASQSGDFNFDTLDPFQPTDLGNLDLGDFNFDTSNNQDNLDSSFDFSDMDFIDSGNTDFSLDDVSFDEG